MFALQATRQKTSEESSSSDSETTTDISILAKAENLDEVQREQLFAAADIQFPRETVVTRTMLQSWQPEITDPNASYILLRRNTAKANTMIINMQAAQRARQQKLFDSARATKSKKI